MASRSIAVTMESSYRFSLSKGLRQDKQKIDAFQDSCACHRDSSPS